MANELPVKKKSEKCNQLQGIYQVLQDIKEPNKPVTMLPAWAGWTPAAAGKSVTYQRTWTLSGSAEDINLFFPKALQLNRIEIFANDATAKSLAVRIFTGNVNTASYSELITLSADTNQSVFGEFGRHYKFIHMPILLRFAISASTAGKILTLKVQVDEL